MRYPCRISLSVLLSLFLTVTGWGQQAYEPGYYIADETRTEVLILNRDWRYHPGELSVRADASAEPFLLPTDSLTEFGIDGKARYVNLQVGIEKGTTDLNRLSHDPEPVRNERVLLRVEIEGQATLYSYLAPQISKYFLAVGDEVPQQLLFTRYRLPDEPVIESRAYRRQLAERLDCGAESGVSDRLGYTLREIGKVVRDYNACVGGSELVYDNRPPKSKTVHLSLVGGAYQTHFRVDYGNNEGPFADLGSRTVPRVGVDLEYPLPFGANKFVLLFRPSYYAFAGSGFETYRQRDYAFSVDYQAIDLAAAFRYYSFLNQDLRLFGSLGFGRTLTTGEFTRERREPPLVTDIFSAAGEVGVSLRGHWNLSLRYEMNSNIIRDLSLSTKTGGLWLSAAYTL